ncbi:2-keto-4-pentenoate hydratase/2-oxohepta-3-ene-1,7-dioic acid hydratase (catechol pathway) [Plantibacter sp. VKM Ac-1784]|uniref:2-keto-4-pentenoate hydratase/2-oxohepta-3-ene-1,7-dioic acid hydratase (Catechol pathway) n=1 Tax=Plantibacter elymi (nom. nud.) TaxID=199708 RepID=A0ABY1R9B3_9MICO|nr:fumarylacetoacetate hydrolase family protein [Plantibacter sp. VKM Ac-1784]SMQ63325.1 2-keto-4-pentenoate hydratase/2-oxohepta-3-ene-1,7-dioic acid hydratase (catechol pathway) [Plantibacter sp. VKM Ac-1784]
MSSHQGIEGLPKSGGGKIIAVHLNYPSRAAQRGRTPEHPSYFLKPWSSVSGTDGTVERPVGAELLAFEGEIAIIIGAAARRVRVEDAWQHVSGVTAANDFGLYDLRSADKGSNLRSKGGDGYTPLGPSVIPAEQIDPAALRVRTWVNGVVVQDDTSDTLLFPFAQLIADLSQLSTLEPGDVILTGTPAGSSVVVPGDVVEVEVDAPTAPGTPTSGRLVTTVVEGTEPFGGFGAKPAADDHQRIEAWGDAAAAGLPAPAEPPTAASPAEPLDPAVAEQLASVSTATLSAKLRARGYTEVFIEGVHASRPGTRMVGVARTLRFVAYRPDLFAERGNGFNAQKRIFDTVEAGEIIVIEARGERGTGTVGDVLALRAQQRGAAGVVTDGGIRDAEQVAAFDLPTFSQGPHPSVLGRRHVPWETDVAITCGGATVLPGDVIVGDGDGVIAIPRALAAEVAAEAVVQEAEDAWIAEQVRGGAAVDGLFPLNAEWRARYESEQGR